MRELTPAEYRTVLAILGQPGTTDAERIRVSQLPSSTFNVARRRAYEEGWVADVALPNPGPCGYAGVEILLARPTVSGRGPLLRSARRDPACVLLWAGLHAVLGVFFRDARRADEASRAPAPEDGVAFRVVADRADGTIPVYFDYGGAWARFGGAEPPAPYPAGLDLGPPASGLRPPAAARALLVGFGRTDGSAPPWTSVPRLPRPHQRAVREGRVRVRTVLDPVRLPAYDGRRIGELILIRGRLRGGRAPSELLNRLTRECGVFPFLLGESRGNVVLAGLGQVRAEGAGRRPVPAARRPVLTTLEEALEPAEVMVEPVEAVARLVDHRYREPSANELPDAAARPPSGRGGEVPGPRSGPPRTGGIDGDER